MLDASFIIHVENVPDRRKSELVIDLIRDFSRNKIRANILEKSHKSDERGESVTIGTIAITLITSGAVVSLIECLKAYFTRERNMIIKLICPDGSQLEINSKNIDTEFLQETMKTIYGDHKKEIK